MLKLTGQPFTEVRIPLGTPTARAEVLRYSPAGLVPILHHGSVQIWDSLAIAEYLAEQFSAIELWPEDAIARARARSISSEMHAGFRNLRRHMPMNCRAYKPGKGMTPGVQKDIDRIIQLWQNCRLLHGQNNGDFLFGKFLIPDAMYAPVMFRFRTYGVELPPVAHTYAESLWQHPFIQEWLVAAQQEVEVIPEVEI